METQFKKWDLKLDDRHQAILDKSEESYKAIKKRIGRIMFRSCHSQDDFYLMRQVYHNLFKNEYEQFPTILGVGIRQELFSTGNFIIKSFIENEYKEILTLSNKNKYAKIN